MLEKIDKINEVKAVYDSGVFDKMVGVNKEKGEPPEILKQFFKGDIDFIENHLERDKYNLEVGCGFGRLLAHLAGVSKKVVGIDFSKEQTKKAFKSTRQFGNVDVELMHAEKMSFEDNEFDQALCLNCSLGNMPGIEQQVINEMKRVVAPGGKIIVRVFADNDKVREAQHKNYERLGFTGIRDDGSAVVTSEGFFSKRFSEDDLKFLFTQAGLEPVIQKDGEGGGNR